MLTGHKRRTLTRLWPRTRARSHTHKYTASERSPGAATKEVAAAAEETKDANADEVAKSLILRGFLLADPLGDRQDSVPHDLRLTSPDHY